MNDLERTLKDTLEEDASRAPLVEHAPTDLRSKVRRRQGLTALVGTVTALAIVAVSIAGLRGLALLEDSDRRIADDPTSARTRTSVVNGVELTYPSDWSLAIRGDEIGVGEGSVAKGEVMLGHVAFQLASFPGTELPYPAGCDRPPAGGVAMEIRDFGSVSDGPPWPVGLTEGMPETPDDELSLCGSDPGIRTSVWRARGRLFQAIVVGSAGPTMDRMLQVYRSMSFGPEPSWEPRTAPDGSLVGYAWVLDSGRTGSQGWNLVTYMSRFPAAPTRVCLGLDIDGSPVDQMCDLDMSLGGAMGMEGRVVRVVEDGSVATYVYGAVAPADAIVTPEDQGRHATPMSPIVKRPMPPSFGVPFVVVIGVSPGRTSGLVRTTDADDGSLLGALPALEPNVTVRLPPA